MTTYVDTSALFTRYVDEADSNRAEVFLENPDRGVGGDCRRLTGARTLDALHLGSAQRLGTSSDPRSMVCYWYASNH